MTIEQAIYAPDDGWRARSPGFLDAWLPEAARLCDAFGRPPEGVACPEALFALPMGRKSVAVVRAAGAADGRLAFRLLVLPAKLYAALGGDPFLVADPFPPDWSARELPTLAWPAGGVPGRTVAQLTEVLNVEAERTQMLLGGVQILIDGGRLAFARPAPDDKTVRDLWALLPTQARTTLWPATFAFAADGRFHVAVLPPDVPPPEGHTKEADAGNYPEGRYELALQTAVESGNQPDLDALLARRGRGQMIWLAVVLLVGFLIASFVLKEADPTPPDPAKQQKKAEDEPKEEGR